jgi:hypothetical protein
MWKKKSNFWELPYWKDLDVRHSIDVMHIEKNVCESLLRIFLNTDGKLGTMDMDELIKRKWKLGQSCDSVKGT